MCWSPEQAVPFDPAEQERHKAKLLVYVCLMQSWQFTYVWTSTHWGGQLTRCASQISLGLSVSKCSDTHWEDSLPGLSLWHTGSVRHSHKKQVLLRESATDRGRYVADLWNAGHLRSAVGSSKSTVVSTGGPRDTEREGDHVVKPCTQHVTCRSHVDHTSILGKLKS